MSGRKLVALLEISTLVCSVPISDAQAGADFSMVLRGSSNYVTRGYTRSDGDPSGSLNLDYGPTPGIFLGVTVARVDFSRMDREHDAFERLLQNEEEPVSAPAQIEFAPYMGFTLPLQDRFRIEFEFAGYLYDGAILGTDYDYAEASLGLYRSDTLAMRVSVAPNAYGYGQTNATLDLQARYPLTDVVYWSGGVGAASVAPVPGYAQLFWNFGLEWAIAPNVSIDVRYHGRHSIATFNREDYPVALPEPFLGFPLVASIVIGF